ncbi:MAG: HlyD family efflux transporter periplasmic adaptor subunit [Chitinophagales bacterium]|nr:HlyD family efflux transporter periplasmic adaptor subunit [Chitinophagales bacterium]
MKQLIIYFSIALVLASCGSKTETQTEQTTSPKTPVEVVAISNGSINDELTLFGTTFYLKRNLVTAPIPAFITDVNVKLGDRVNKGDVLYILQSKESRALGNDVSKIDSTLKNFGIIKVTAPATGIISTLDKQQSGDYVLEGTQLCTIAESNDLVFQVNVPYEFTTYTKTGNSCTIILPDNTEHSATFTKALTAMNVTAQTQTILAKCSENLFLPEYMMVKVGINKGTQNKKQVLPKSCVLSDEMMKEFWVMKLINDSTAIKIPVNVGSKNSERIEILTPKFEVTDQIISKGNYGLPDTALVTTLKQEAK